MNFEANLLEKLLQVNKCVLVVELMLHIFSTDWLFVSHLVVTVHDLHLDVVMEKRMHLEDLPTTKMQSPFSLPNFK